MKDKTDWNKGGKLAVDFLNRKQKDVEELTDLYKRKMPHIVPSFCRKLAEIAIEGGYAYGKCFNLDHSQKGTKHEHL